MSGTGFLVAANGARAPLSGEILLAGLSITPLPGGRYLLQPRGAGGGATPSVHANTHQAAGADPLDLDAIAGNLDAAKLYGDASISTARATGRIFTQDGFQAWNDPDFDAYPVIQFGNGLPRVLFADETGTTQDVTVGRSAAGVFSAIAGLIRANELGGAGKDSAYHLALANATGLLDAAKLTGSAVLTSLEAVSITADADVSVGGSVDVAGGIDASGTISAGGILEAGSRVNAGVLGVYFGTLLDAHAPLTNIPDTAALCTNLDADKLDGQHGSYYSALVNATGVLAAVHGGTGADGSALAASLVLASPSGGSGAASYRALVAADIPSLDASKITTGTLARARVDAAVAYTDTANTFTAAQTIQLAAGTGALLKLVSQSVVGGSGYNSEVDLYATPSIRAGRLYANVSSIASNRSVIFAAELDHDSNKLPFRITTLDASGNATVGMEVGAGAAAGHVNYGGSNAVASSVLAVSGTTSGATTQPGVDVAPISDSTATAAVSGLRARGRTAAAPFTTAQLISIRARTPVLGAGSSATLSASLYVEDGSGVGTSSYSVYIAGGSTYLGGALQHAGTTAGVFNVTPAARVAARTITNDSSSRTLDVSTATLAQLANFVATMARDLITYGWFQ